MASSNEKLVKLYGFKTLEDIHLDKKEWIDSIPLSDFVQSDVENYKKYYPTNYFAIISVSDDIQLTL